MCEMIGYVFKRLESSEDSLKNIRKVLRSQKSANQGVVIFAWATVAYMVLELRHDQKQNAKIEKLNNEIRELKRMKGK